MKKFLIITTINEPTPAVKLFSSHQSWQVVVVGDKKTPKNWKCENVIYLSCEEQEKFGFNLPWNNYVRKMIGYLFAIQNGAGSIAETDDDNLPYSYWNFPSNSEYDCFQTEGFLNIYRFFSNQYIWPRGFPLDKIYENSSIQITPKIKQVGIWQGLADKDPDVDAIYRLTNGRSCVFEKRSPMVLDKGVVCPFNSQNTLFKKEMFPLLYLPVTVNQRFADILRGYVAQPIMWSKGYVLGFTEATVIQNRNPHDLLKDFEDEIPCYTQSEKAYRIAKKTATSKHSIAGNLMNVYCELANAGIVKSEELGYLCDWLDKVGEE